MSRVDEALRIAEGAPDPQRNAAPVDTASSLEQYRREGGGRRAREEGALRPVDIRRHVPPPNAEPPPESRPPRAPQDADVRARLVSSTSNTVPVEQYRRLAAALHEEHARGRVSTVMVTSAVPREGKSLTVVNLALTLSESYGQRVLVIDADLRSPSVHVILGIPNERGLSDALAVDGDTPIAQISENLGVLTAGRPAASPLAGLSSRRMEEIVRDAANRFEWILIDTSPVGVLPDAQVLSRLVDGVILVIGAGSTPAAAVERAVAELGGPDAIIGTVLNRVDVHRIPDAIYYGQYRPVGSESR